MLKVDFIVGIEAKPLGYSPWQLFKAKKKFDLKGGGGVTSRCSGKEPALLLLPRLTAGRMNLALLTSTNKKSSCLNRAGCINYLSRSSKEVVL